MKIIIVTVIIGACLLLFTNVFQKKTLNEPASTTQPLEEARVQGASYFTLSEEISQSDIPEHLRSKSAHRLKLNTLLNLSQESLPGPFTFTLNKGEEVVLTPTKETHNTQGLTTLFGSVKGEGRSHFKMIFRSQKLVSGSLSFLDDDTHYVISQLADQTLVLSLTDPEIEITSCGCPTCQAP